MDVTICHIEIIDDDDELLPPIIDWIPEPWRNWIPPGMPSCTHPQIKEHDGILLCTICEKMLF